jgi:purine-binding chemotaxis protein CheW
MSSPLYAKCTIEPIKAKNFTERRYSVSRETDVISQTVDIAAAREGKYLTFSLADEAYGIGILKIKEIIGMMPITIVPKKPEFVKGVIDLRGKVIPVIDLRLRFGMEDIG